MLTISDPTEQANWNSCMQRYRRGKTYPPELDQKIIDLAKNPKLSLREVKDQNPCKSGYVDAVLWRARRRNLL